MYSVGVQRPIFIKHHACVLMVHGIAHCVKRLIDKKTIVNGSVCLKIRRINTVVLMYYLKCCFLYCNSVLRPGTKPTENRGRGVLQTVTNGLHSNKREIVLMDPMTCVGLSHQ